MAAGLIFGALAKGLGEGGNKYIDLEEKQRAEEATRQQRFQELDMANRMRGQEKDDDQARKNKRMLEFKTAAEEWRKANPQASMESFVQHFAQTEHADLLAPSLQAAGLDRQAKLADAQIQHYKDLAEISERSAKRQDAAAARSADAAERADRRLQLAEDEAKEKREEQKKSKGLLAGYLTAEGNPVAQQMYRRELRIMGLDPEGKVGGDINEKTITEDPKTGQKVETTITKKAGPAPDAPYVVQGAELTNLPEFQGHPIWRDAQGRLFYYPDDKGIEKPRRPPANWGGRPGATGGF